MVAEVIVDITHVYLDKIFDYYFDDYHIKCGSRVIVPFGKTFIEGIVINIKENSDYAGGKLKSITRLLEQTPVLTEETIKLAKYIVNTCYVTFASALRLFLPSEMRKGKVKSQFTKLVELDGSLNVD